MVSSLGHGILPGLNDIMEPLLDLASKPRALKVGTVGTWNIWLNLRWFCWGKKTVVCSLWDWVGLEWGRGWMPFQFWKTKQRRCVSLAFTVHLQLCDMWSSARGNFSRTLSRIWTREMAKFGDWRQCKDVQGSCGHLTSRNYGHSRCGLFYVSSAGVLLILDFQDGQVLHSLAALCRSVGGMLSPFLGKFLEAHQLWKSACSLSLICIQFMWSLSTCNISWLSTSSHPAQFQEGDDSRHFWSLTIQHNSTW